MKVSMGLIKQLREQTGAGVMEAKRALEEVAAKGDVSEKKLLEDAAKIVVERGMAKAEKKADRETKQGVVYAYVHHDHKSGAMVKLQCETDFVARTDDFVNLAKELAMQVVSMQPKDTKELMAQAYVRDPKLTVEQLVKQTAGKVGENVQVADFTRMGLEEE